MSSPPRILLPGTVVLITTRTEEGLPFASNAYIEAIVESAMARAQTLYPVEVCHFVIMGNHLHIIIRVVNPEDVVGFMDRVKTEIAHGINRLLGRRKRTVWCSGYDAVPILTLEDAINKIVYVYTNPQSANLVASIDEYPGFSSWKMWRTGDYQFEAPWILRNEISRLQSTVLTRSMQEAIARKLKLAAKASHTFRLKPNAWMSTFGITDEVEIDRVNGSIYREIKGRETELQNARCGKGTRCLGVDRLIDQPIDMQHIPKKFGKRMWCICRDVLLRIKFINYIKSLRLKAREVLERWKLGDFSTPYPLGMFPPTFPRLGNLLPQVFA